VEKLEKTLEEWKQMLDPEQYNVCRLKATERPFTGKYNSTKTDGVYHCICCNEALFDSTTKFDSGCGWPSFYAPIEGSAVVEVRDVSHGMIRTEVVCAKCDAHLATDRPALLHQLGVSGSGFPRSLMPRYHCV